MNEEGAARLSCRRQRTEAQHEVDVLGLPDRFSLALSLIV